MSQNSAMGKRNSSSPQQTELLAVAYRKYLRFWVNLAKTIHISGEEAEDIVHGVISSILSNPTKEFESLEHARNYVAKSVLNRAIQARQRNERKTGWSEQAELQFPVDPEAVDQDEAFRMQVLKEGILRLSKKDFEIIKLRFYSGYTFNEIRQLLNAPISTLKSREEAALRRIRKWLRKNGL